MNPFQVFRFWARRAPAGERTAAAVAAAAVLSLLIWVAVPASGTGSSPSAFPGGGNPGGTNSANGGSGAGGQGGTTGKASRGVGQGSSGSGGSSGSSGSFSGSGTGGGNGGAQGCQSPPGSATGVSANEVKIAVFITDIAGPAADSSFGVADPKVQRAAYQAAVNDLNARGGLACRHVIPTYFTVNAANQSSLRQTCLDVAQGGFYAVLDSGAYANSTLETCYGESHIPYFTSYILPDSIRKHYYPYLFSFGTYDRIYHDSIFALRDRGVFSKSHGFKKLGLFYRSCFGDIINEVQGWLHQAGVKSIDTFNLGCPQALANPLDVQNAVAKFKRDGVTTVFGVQALADLGTFTSDAQSQGFHPHYALADDELVTVTQSGSFTKPNAANFNGALAIAFARDGEEHTSGAHPTAGTVRCNRIIAKQGLSTTYREKYAVGNACDAVWMLEAAVDHAPSIQQNALSAGLQAAKSVDFSFPQGPNSFSAAGETAAGQYWRPVQFAAGCGCWHVVSSGFHRSTY